MKIPRAWDSVIRRVNYITKHETCSHWFSYNSETAKPRYATSVTWPDNLVFVELVEVFVCQSQNGSWGHEVRISFRCVLSK